MTTATIDKTPTIAGTPYAGGFYAGRIRVGNDVFAIVVAPKAQGQTTQAWNDNTNQIEDAQSLFDGYANTVAMAAAGSDLAKDFLRLNINGFTDWYLPSRDELEICYRNLKPTTNKNYCWRGDNPSSVPVGYAYSKQSPAQTIAKPFQEGEEEAFSTDDWYWTSTQDAGYDDYAWVQYFFSGGQHGYHKSSECRARAVRRLLIIE